jgi:hypothetical protein
MIELYIGVSLPCSEPASEIALCAHQNSKYGGLVQRNMYSSAMDFRHGLIILSSGEGSSVPDAGRYPTIFFNQLINYDDMYSIIFPPKLFTLNAILIYFINFLDLPDDPKYI